MKPIILLPIVLFAYLYAQRPDGDCCPKKVVGGKTYTFIGTGPDEVVRRYNCSSNCFYSLLEEPSTKFCFKPGMFESKCAADGNMTMSTMSGGGMSSQGSDIPGTSPMPGASSPMPGGGSTSGGSGGTGSGSTSGGSSGSGTSGTGGG